MGEYESSHVFTAGADAVWTLVSDPSRLPSWVPTTTRAEPQGSHEVHLEGDSHGHSYSMDSAFEADDEQRRLAWSSGRDDGYGGWLQVTERGDRGCEVTVHVSIPQELPASADPNEVNRGLEESLGRLEQAVTTGR